MTKNWTPDWVDNMNEDVVAKDYWHYTGGGMPLRYSGGGYQHGGYEHGYSHHAMRDYGDHQSIRSSKSSQRSRRTGAAACCIFLLLLLGALLIAIGVGVMVYYLMRMDHPKANRHITTEADASVPLLNVNYTDAMEHNTSQAFLAVSDPLCKEIDKYFQDSIHKHRYRGCSIEELAPDHSAETCECAGILNKTRTTRANFRLVFLGDISNIRDEVRRVIVEKADRTEGTDYRVLLVDKFVIDISSKFPDGYSTPKPPPAVGVLANLTIWVYNLNYTQRLANPLSVEFQTLAQPFCQDLTRIFKESSFAGRYHSCEVKKFSPSPDVVIVEIWLTDDDITGVEGGFRQIILNKAKNVTINGQVRKIIGDLLITPEFGEDGPIIVIPIPLNPLETITPTATMGPGYQRYIDMHLYLYGFTYNSSFGDTNSQLFQSYAYGYCKELERLLMLSSWNGHYSGCRLYKFYPKISTHPYPYYGTYLHIDDTITNPREIIDIIKTHGTSVTVANSTLLVYQIGDLKVIIGGDTVTDRINITYLHSTLMMTSTPMLSPSMTPTILPSVFTTSSNIQPTQTLGQTVTPSSSLVIVIYNSTTAYIRGGLYDFNYTPDLTDMTSTRFMNIQTKFCDDLDGFFEGSILKNQYLSCRIVYFTSSNPPEVQFTLNFQHELTQMLQTEIKRIISASAPASIKGGYQVITIGDLDLIVSQISYTVSVTNYTDVTETTFRPTPTMSMEMTSTPYISYSATLADITCEVVSNIPAALEDKSTDIFKNQQLRFCATLEGQFVPAIVDMYTHISCYIVKFGKSPNTIRFHNIFGKSLTSQFKTQILNTIYNIPKSIINGFIGHDVAGVGLKADSCKITLIPVNYTDTMTVFPSILPTSTVIQPTIDIFHCLRQPCKYGGTCVEDNPGWHCECLAGLTGKDCSIDIDDCDPNPCQNDGFCYDGLNSFYCECTDAWTGQYCTKDVNECETNLHMCGPGGKCVNNPGNYTCECLFGYQGPLCNQEIDPCLASPCENDGTCTKTGPGTFVCDCPYPWNGPTCTQYLGVCQPNPCQHNGTCIDDDTNPRCLCTSQWTGRYCQNDVNECIEDPNTCNGNGLCVNKQGGVTCNCYRASYGPLWTGDRCERDVNECELSDQLQLCVHGECVNQQGGYACICQRNFTGLDCSQDVNECDSLDTPCLYGGTCRNVYGGYECDCVEGYTGPRCGKDVNECEPAPGPCENDGACYNSFGSYRCDCRTEWTGPLCEEDVNECALDPFKCKNGGSCINLEGDYQCNCTEEWSGKQCEIYSELCGNLRCLHGGTCRINNGIPSCECPPTRTGPRCETDVNECNMTVPICKNNATCHNLEGSFYCACKPGFTGETCGDDINECDPNPCENSGQCVNIEGSFYCNCTKGWQGTYCGEDIPECDLLDEPCNGNGNCYELRGSYRCDCSLGWKGTFCDMDVNECETTGCLNNGTCNNYPGTWNCTCPPEWKGLFCEMDVDECMLPEPPCKNGATCSNINNGYKCHCTDYWTGPDCKQDVNECTLPNPPCKNGATCTNFNGGYTCNCTQYWTGKDCDQDVNECTLSNPPCKNGASCTNSQGGYTCNCTQFWMGKDCDQDVNECTLPNPPCKNGATCNNKQGNYQCNCTEFWMGKDCNEDVNECTLPSPPCKNGASCTNNQGGYTCNCTQFWMGKDCNQDVNECELAIPPCGNGATCKNSEGDYECVCTEFWKGKDCKEDVNECTLPNPPCKNGASCTNNQGGYTCNCTQFWMGKDCNQDVNECEFAIPPCGNGATCKNSEGDYECVCTVSWKGKDCKDDVNECVESATPLCLNNGVCVNTQGSYECNCTQQYTGSDCGDDVNECEAAIPPCENGGTCVNDIGDYHCECPPEWTGKNCRTNIDACSTVLCVHGQCLKVGNVYQCVCDFGWQGPACNQNINECLDPTTCKNGATCQDLDGDFMCNCTQGYEGKDCGNNINECLDPITCKNGATCQDLDGDYMCNCTQGYEGKDCGNNINECLDPTTCKNGATCQDLDGDFMCNCTQGYEGKDCGNNINECLDPTTCKNGATCQDLDGDFMCNCTQGYEGKDCGNNINECLDPTTCKNGATCQDLDGDYMCNCTQGYEGKDCGNNINECLDPTTCKNGATCQDLDGDYMCNCTQGYEGKDCGNNINECLDPTTCKNGAMCQDLDGDYMCNCTQGYEGKDCGNNINECLDPTTCKNGATCQDLDGDFMCNCTQGYEGKDCGDNINECLDPTTCKNGATCQDLDGDYMCNCTQGYEGKDCGNNINECLDSTTCKNGATCQDLDGDFMCNCTQGYEGKDCGNDTDECLLNPCKNGATCQNSVGSYTCICVNGYLGPNCTDVVQFDFSIQFDLVEDVTELLNTSSPKFLEYAQEFCEDMTNILQAAPGTDFDNYDSCEVTSYLEHPTERDKINWVATFIIGAASSTGDKIKNYILKEIPTQVFGDVNAIPIGNNYIYQSDHISRLPVQFRLVDDVNKLPQLLDPTSMQFQQYSTAFCNAISNIMESSGLFLTYNNCTVTSFSVKSDQTSYIDWTANFRGVNPGITDSGIKSFIIATQQPIIVGDANAVKIGLNNIFVSDIVSSIDIQLQLLDDVTNEPNLLDKTSQEFLEYSQAFCNEMLTIMAASPDFEKFQDCTVKTYGTNPDQITWTANFLGTAPGITPQDIKNHIFTAKPKIVVGEAEVVKVGNNNIFVSDHFTSFPIAFELVGDVSSNPGLMNTDSVIFKNYSEAFCTQISNILTSSGIFETFNNCEVLGFGMNPDHINWTANFLGEATGIKADGIKSYILMTQPTQIVGDANAVIIGNNNVYKSDYISTISVTFDLIDDLDNLDPDIFVPGSVTFNDYAVPFCEEISSVLDGAQDFTKFQQCDVTSYRGPIRDQVTWTARFLGTAPGITPDTLKSFIFGELPKFITSTGNTYAVEIGNNIVYVSDYKSVFPIQFELVPGDVSNHTELMDKTSTDFAQYSKAFCDKIANIMTTSGLFQTYENCTVLGFGTGPDHINWTANFIGPAPGITANGIKDYILRSEPKTIVGDANAVKIGNNFIFESPYISTITVTFDLLDDISSLPELQNPNSPTFQTYSQAFCREVSAIMAEEYPKYKDCTVTSYGAQPDQITWTADFLGPAPGLTPDMIKSSIFQALPKRVFDDANVVDIGNNIVYESDHVTTFPIQFELVPGDVSNNINLMNQQSQTFLDYSDAFCDQISHIMTTSGLFETYDNCAVLGFGTGPDHVNWTANFHGTAPGITTNGIKDYIIRSEPKVIVGDANAVKIGNNFVFESPHITKIPIKFELIDDITPDSQLLVPGSQLFLEYSQAFCQQISAIMNSGDFPKFQDCEVTSYGAEPDEITWTADFLGTAPGINPDSLRTYIFNELPKVIIDDSDAVEIGNNVIFVSDHITPFSLQMEIVDDLTSPELQGLLDTESQLFQNYSQAFCEGIAEIMTTSAAFDKFSDCAVTSFGTDPFPFHHINWTANFLGLAEGITVDEISGFILATEPTEIFNGASVVRVGNNHLYIDDVSTFPIDFQLVDDISALLDTSSDAFAQYSKAFCDDINVIMTSNTGAAQFFPYYRDCQVVNYYINNTYTPSATINWLAHFDGIVPSATGQNVKNFIRERQPKVILGSFYVIHIGNNNVYYLPYITTDVVLEKMLLNFTYGTELEDPTSERFQNLSSSFCNMVSDLIQANTVEFVNFDSCSILNFHESTSGNSFVNYQLKFNGDQNATQIELDFYRILERDLPKIQFGQDLGYRIGDLVLFYDTAGALTRVSMTYDLLNLSYSAALQDPNTAEFIQHSSLFCNDLLDIAEVLTVEAPTCTVDGYSNGDPFVEVAFTIEFPDTLDVGQTQAFISQSIFDDKLRVRVDVGTDSYLGNIVGDVVVYHDSLLDYTDIVYDGWILNVTQESFGLASNPDVFNSSSARFKEVQQIICDAYTPKFEAFEHTKDRYDHCFIADVSEIPNQQPTATISFLLEGREPFLQEEIIALLKDFRQVPIGGKTYSFVGDKFALYTSEFDEIKVNVSDYRSTVITTPATTDNPNVVTSIVKMQFEISNSTLTPELEDVTSTEFLQKEQEFCTWQGGFDDIFSRQFSGNQSETILNKAMYENCSLDRFSSSNDIDYVHVDLTFKGEVNHTRSNIETILNALIEHGQRVDLIGDPNVEYLAVQIPVNSTSPIYLDFPALQVDDIFEASFIEAGPTTTPPPIRTLVP